MVSLLHQYPSGLIPPSAFFSRSFRNLESNNSNNDKTVSRTTPLVPPILFLRPSVPPVLLHPPTLPPTLPPIPVVRSYVDAIVSRVPDKPILTEIPSSKSATLISESVSSEYPERRIVPEPRPSLSIIIKRLIVLDLNKLLIFKVKREWTIKLRPGLAEFLNFCFKYAHVGFYTCSAYDTAHSNIQEFRDRGILTSKMVPLFIWTRNDTRPDPDNVKSKWERVKVLGDCLINSKLNPIGEFSWHNSIIIDDSADKLRFNPTQNQLIIPEWLGDDQSDTKLISAIPKIEMMFHDLVNMPVARRL